GGTACRTAGKCVIICGLSAHGEVREWPNRAVSKTAVLATGPWVRSPPSPPNPPGSCRRLLRRVFLVHLVYLVCLVQERKKPKDLDRPDQPVSLFTSVFSFNARLSSTIAKVSRAQYRNSASSIVARSTQSVSTKT